MASITRLLYISMPWTSHIVKRRDDMHISKMTSSHEQPMCVQPKLLIWNEDLKNRTSCKAVVCAAEENWVYTANGRFYISGSAQERHGAITCGYLPIANDQDNTKYLQKVVPVLNGSLLESDAFKVICRAKEGSEYKNVHACVALVPRLVPTSYEDSRRLYNVLIFGFDSLSRQAFQRYLPEAHRYFTQTLGGVVLEGYNIVGDGTPQALMPILTGRTETEIPEVRRGKPGARHVDEVLEFIWKKYERRGYVTQWGEDMAHIGTFNFRMTGFKEQPVHHYMRPYLLEAQRARPYFNKSCMGSKPSHIVFTEWLKEGINTHSGHPFFMFGFFSEYSHNNNDCVGLADHDLVKFFQYVSKLESFDRTFIFLMSDHGLRIGPIRKTEQGKLEERMPYFAVLVPRMYRQTFQRKYDNLLINAKRLTTPFDIYETLLDILHGNAKENYKTEGQMSRGYSLFSPIPASRTCADASIEAHWCACLNWIDVSITDDSYVQKAATYTIMRFNSIIQQYENLCQTLVLKRITKAIKFVANENVLKFKNTKDIDGRIPDLSDNTTAQRLYYQITLETTPGNGVFEVTSSVDVTSGQINMDDTDVSRINRYGDSPNCIVDKNPALRPYCVCKTG